MSKQVWQAKDAELFETEEECLRHERACLILIQMNDTENYIENEKCVGLQENFSRHFLGGCQRKESFWNYAESFRTLADILDGKRPDLPMEKNKLPKVKNKLLPASRKSRYK